MAKEVTVVGRPGGPFNIEGEGFGTGGSVVIAGRTVEITRWNDRSVKGMLPADLPATGDVTLTPAGGTPFTGKWPAKRGAGQIVTIRTSDGTLVQGELVTGIVGAVAGTAPKAEVTQPLTPAGPDKNPPPGSLTNPAPIHVGDAAGHPATGTTSTGTPAGAAGTGTTATGTTKT